MSYFIDLVFLTFLSIMLFKNVSQLFKEINEQLCIQLHEN